MINPAMLDAYVDDDVREIEALCQKVLKTRADNKKAEAIEDARVRLAIAGLTFNDAIKVKGKPVKGPSYKGGFVYQHPTDKTLVWRAKGKKPGWLVDLEAGGGRPIESPKNDNFLSASRKVV